MQELPHTTLSQAAPSRAPRLGTPPHRALSVPQTPWPSSKPCLWLRVRPPASAPLLLQSARLSSLPLSPTSPLLTASPCSLPYSNRPRYTSLLLCNTCCCCWYSRCCRAAQVQRCLLCETFSCLMLHAVCCCSADHMHLYAQVVLGIQVHLINKAAARCIQC